MGKKFTNVDKTHKYATVIVNNPFDVLSFLLKRNSILQIIKCFKDKPARTALGTDQQVWVH